MTFFKGCSSAQQESLSLCKMCQNMGFLCFVFSCIRTECDQRKPVFWQILCTLSSSLKAYQSFNFKRDNCPNAHFFKKKKKKIHALRNFQKNDTFLFCILISYRYEKLESNTDGFKIEYGSSIVKVTYKPMKIDFFDGDGVLLMSLNNRGLLNFEHYRVKK